MSATPIDQAVNLTFKAVGSQAQREIAAIAGGMHKLSSSVMATVTSWKSLAISAAGITTFTVGIRHAMKEAEEFLKMSGKLKMSVESLSTLGAVFEMEGSSVGEMNAALRMMTMQIRRLNMEADEKKNPFRAYGISIKQLKSAMSDGKMEKVLASMADAYADAKEKGVEAVSALEKSMGGRGLSYLLPVFAKLTKGGDELIYKMREAKKEGMEISTEFAKQANQFSDAWTKVNLRIRREVYGGAIKPLLPIMNAAMGWLADTKAISTFGQNLSKAIGGAANILAAILFSPKRWDMLKDLLVASFDYAIAFFSRRFSQLGSLLADVFADAMTELFPNLAKQFGIKSGKERKEETDEFNKRGGLDYAQKHLDPLLIERSKIAVTAGVGDTLKAKDPAQQQLYEFLNKQIKHFMVGDAYTRAKRARDGEVDGDADVKKAEARLKSVASEFAAEGKKITDAFVNQYNKEKGDKDKVGIAAIHAEREKAGERGGLNYENAGDIIKSKIAELEKYLENSAFGKTKWKGGYSAGGDLGRFRNAPDELRNAAGELQGWREYSKSPGSKGAMDRKYLPGQEQDLSQMFQKLDNMPKGMADAIQKLAIHTSITVRGVQATSTTQFVDQ